MDAAPGHHQVGRQVAVHGMSDLVDVVADAPQLGEQRGVHQFVGWLGTRLDLPVQHQSFAKSRNGKRQLARHRSLERVIILRHADADHFRAGTFLVCPSLWHLPPHKVGFGARGIARPDRRGPGECGALSPASGI